MSGVAEANAEGKKALLPEKSLENIGWRARKDSNSRPLDLKSGTVFLSIIPNDLNPDRLQPRRG
jgi:hypothetical protein